MSDLQVCEACQRHIRATESTCPFCDSERSNRSILGTALLAGAFAGASALGCSDERPGTKAPPPVKDSPAVVSTDAAAVNPIESMDAAAANPDEASTLDAGATDTGVTDAGAVDAAAPKTRKKRKKQLNKQVEKKKAVEAIIHREPPPMPYGAPPLRRRLV